MAISHEVLAEVNRIVKRNLFDDVSVVLSAEASETAQKAASVYVDMVRLRELAENSRRPKKIWKLVEAYEKEFDALAEEAGMASDPDWPFPKKTV